MKHLIYFDDYLYESVLEIDTIYTKYYNTIERYVFDKIIEADPTTVLKDSKMGVYCKWMLKLYSNGKLLLEDLYKATNYLSAFHQFKHKITQKDINSYKSLPELSKVVEPYLEKEESKFENDEERKLAGQFKEVFRNDEYRIIIPLTLNASKYFGRDTEWCTTQSGRFASYTEDQDADKIIQTNLYILYTENLNDRLQFHFQANQFMDISDKKINTNDFFESNIDIFDFFNKYFDVEKHLDDITWRGNTLEGAPEIVKRSFKCRENNLISLQGAPRIVEGWFDCSDNKLRNLMGGPEKVAKGYSCDNNKLTSLNGSPQTVENDFTCRDNKLTNLVGGPVVVVDGRYNCTRNNLSSLEGAPEYIGGDFICYDNKNLSEKEITLYYNTGAVKGTIHSDYGEFRQAK